MLFILRHFPIRHPELFKQIRKSAVNANCALSYKSNPLIYDYFDIPISAKNASARGSRPK